jgi:hypothetical protein
MQMKEVTEKQWVAGVRQKLAEQFKVDPAEVRFAPGRTLVAFVRQLDSGPVRPPAARPPRHPKPRRYQIVVVEPTGVRRGLFAPVTARGSEEPPRDFRFLTEDRLVYEVVQPAPPPPPAPSAHRKPAPPRRSAHARPGPHPPAPAHDQKVAEPALPRRVFVIQPVAPPPGAASPGARRLRRILCQGVRFAFAPRQDRLAFVAGKPEAAFVSVNGAQVYPRKGRTVIASDLAWSKDGISLAFVERMDRPDPSAAAGRGRLVLLADVDNPTGDTTWDLPAAASLEAVRVFWAGSGKLVVGKTAVHPVFAASFVKEKPPDSGGRFKNAGP